MPHVLNNFKQALDPEDRLHNITEVPAILETMIAEGYTGRKGKGGLGTTSPRVRSPWLAAQELILPHK
jgi:3-hydroxyacyl-CoA dehydrogenase